MRKLRSDARVSRLQRNWNDANSNWYFGNPITFSSYIGWTDETIVATRARLINAPYTAVSSAVPIIDVQRSTEIDLTLKSLTRDAEDARVSWDATIDISALKNSNC